MFPNPVAGPVSVPAQDSGAVRQQQLFNPSSHIHAGQAEPGPGAQRAQHPSARDREIKDLEAECRMEGVADAAEEPEVKSKDKCNFH